MITFLYLILFYVSLFLLWLTINLVVFAISYLKRKNFLVVFRGINNAILYFIQISVFLWGITTVIDIIRSKEWILLFAAFFVGGLIIQFQTVLYVLLQTPFILITNHLIKIVDSKKGSKWEEFDAEVISPDGKVIERFESDDKTNKRLAFWFLFNYIVGLLAYLSDGEKWGRWNWSDFITMPFIAMLIVGIPVMIIVSISNLLRYKKLVKESKRYYFACVSKIIGYLYILLFVISILIKWSAS